jgi:hypothetical protein
MNRRELLKSACFLGATVSVAGCGASNELLSPAHAQVTSPPSFERELLEPDNSDEVSAVALQPSFGPVPYLASDGNHHLTYEIGIANISPAKIRIDKIEVLDDADRQRALRTIEGEGVLRLMTLLAGGGDINELESSQAGTLYLDAWIPTSEAVPGVLVHRISGTNLVTNEPLAKVLGARMRVRSDIAIPVLAPPARGTGWVCAEACCGRSHHRRTPISINGEIYLSQRYAIDFVRLVDGELFSGDPFQLENWHVYGVELLAVAEGVVTSVMNDQREWPLGHSEITAKKYAAGNHVVVTMANGMSYVFAHMQPGSVRVRLGDTVTTGQVLGLAGNSGITGGPHLHMHVVTGSDIFQGQGIPWGFDRYTVTGYFPTVADLTPDEPSNPINRVDVPPFEVRGGYPQELRIIDFA